MSLPEVRVSERISRIGESVTMKIDARAKALKAEGQDVIGFGAGEPNFPTPEYIVDAALRAAQNPQYHRYTPAAGLPQLREAIAEKTRRDSHYSLTPEQVLVTNGGKQAVYMSFAALLNPGDDVLLPSPYWTTYPEAISLTGAKTVPVFSGAADEYKVSVEQLEAARTPKTRVLVFVSPSNPTGAVYSPEETHAIGKWAAEQGLWVITDEIYENLTYDDVPFTSIASVEELADQVVVISGVAKSYAMTGWRVGWLCGPRDVVKAAEKLQTHLTSNVANVSQMAALSAISGPQEPIEQMRQAFDRRRRLIVERLNAIAGFRVPMPHGAFYAYPDVHELLGREHRGTRIDTSAELAAYILDKAEVAVVPGEAFGPSGYLRFSYALGDEDLLRGMDRLTELFGSA